jgi:hypothetical protein
MKQLTIIGLVGTAKEQLIGGQPLARISVSVAEERKTGLIDDTWFTVLSRETGLLSSLAPGAQVAVTGMIRTGVFKNAQGEYLPDVRIYADHVQILAYAPIPETVTTTVNRPAVNTVPPITYPEHRPGRIRQTPSMAPPSQTTGGNDDLPF